MAQDFDKLATDLVIRTHHQSVWYAQHRSRPTDTVRKRDFRLSGPGFRKVISDNCLVARNHLLCPPLNALRPSITHASQALPPPLPTRTKHRSPLPPLPS